MRELVYYVATSIDGFIADPSGGFDAFPMEGDHMAALLADYADAFPAHVLGALGMRAPGTTFDTVIMGWNTLRPALDAGIESPYPHLRQVVASRGDRRVADDVTLTSDPVDAVRRLKGEDGLPIWLCGGGELAGSLRGEIDRLVLKRNPVAFGAGVPLFGHAGYSPQAFTLRATQRFESGVTIDEYVRRDERQSA
ncbi:dihydrofolate reductase family protein [Pseudoclavibacter sp. RFBA6]|uniref:dihydrofolate reductase family protein n=1 Tax=Pseudoclavibacter sp. RFBA6 TaxID=2080573 RepID=UPI000CE8D28D|nr:dihydrofolate reductase family protein [Pseudoclavibacter sp. RFBA6]PPG39167.1 riboflavin biosynthesis protein RibD [Pseudoclavibacter sp. RFBA6]